MLCDLHFFYLRTQHILAIWPCRRYQPYLCNLNPEMLGELSFPSWIVLQILAALVRRIRVVQIAEISPYVRDLHNMVTHHGPIFMDSAEYLPQAAQHSFVVGRLWSVSILICFIWLRIALTVNTPTFERICGNHWVNDTDTRKGTVYISNDNCKLVRLRYRKR